MCLHTITTTKGIFLDGKVPHYFGLGIKTFLLNLQKKKLTTQIVSCDVELKPVTISGLKALYVPSENRVQDFQSDLIVAFPNGKRERFSAFFPTKLGYHLHTIGSMYNFSSNDLESFVESLTGESIRQRSVFSFGFPVLFDFGSFQATDGLDIVVEDFFLPLTDFLKVIESQYNLRLNKKFFEIAKELERIAK